MNLWNCLTSVIFWVTGYIWSERMKDNVAPHQLKATKCECKRLKLETKKKKGHFKYFGRQKSSVSVHFYTLKAQK